MMNYYLCIGLGVFLALTAVDKQNPHADLSPLMTVVMFVVTLFIWPASVIANFLMSLRIRRMEAELDILMKEVISGNKTGTDLKLVENNHEETNNSDSTGA